MVIGGDGRYAAVGGDSGGVNRAIVGGDLGFGMVSFVCNLCWIRNENKY